MSVTFENQRCVIFSKDGKFLFKIPMQNKVFAFDPAKRGSTAMACVQGEQEEL